MIFALRIDETEAAAKAPDLLGSTAELAIKGNMLSVHLGEELSFTADLAAVARAQLLPDPRPHIFLPLGVSAAAQQLGADTLCAIGSYEGLLRIDFRNAVEARIRPPDLSADNAAPSTATIEFSHLIVSLEDPDGCADALNGQAAGSRE